jgi:nucleobase:cation symporter-1, NCS1 family
MTDVATAPPASANLLESNSVNFVPHSQRHGTPKSLFTLWFGANATGVTILTGALAASTSLSLLWGAIAIIIGTLVGSVFVAYHSAQGPVLGLPQMIQSRAQFGFAGANLPLIVVVAMYLGFFGGGTILSGDAVADLTGSPVWAGILITGVIALALVIFGYRVIHVVARIITPAFVVVFIALTVVTIVNWPHNAHHAQTSSGFSATGFFLILGVAAAYHITYGPYVADYSRYLPADTRVTPTFWYTYGGVALSGVWTMILGAAVQIGYSNLGIAEALGAMAGTEGAFLRDVVLIVLILGLINIGALNIYGAAMSSLTIANTFMKKWRATRGLRLAFMIPVGLIGVIGSVALSSDFINAYQNFILFLIVFLIPWSAINLVDFYLVNRGHYVLDDLFTPSGRYGAFNKAGLAAYLIGCVLLTPFVNSGFYSGYIGSRLGFDLSWIVGLILPAALYLVFTRAARRRAVAAETGIAPSAEIAASTQAS